MKYKLEAILNKYHVDCPVDKFVTYLTLLQKWNKAYNLTAIRELDAMASLHIADSLAILPYIQGHYLLDVGSGAGLPGIPIALSFCITSADRPETDL